jgi:hypothetical protein|tara:strand:+ start:269 stop:592 length:324 start_codon:yes stop_codon:yes gene_type:complete
MNEDKVVNLAEIIEKEDFEHAMFKHAIKLYNKRKVASIMAKADRWGRKTNFDKAWMINIGKAILEARDDKKMKYKNIQKLIETDHNKTYSIARLSEIYKHYKNKEKL